MKTSGKAFSVLFLLTFLIILLSGKVAVYAAQLAPPRNFKAEINRNYIELRWNNNDISSDWYYTIIEKSVDHGEFHRVTSLYKGRTSYKDHSVTNGHVYTYRARTNYRNNSSPYTQEQEVIIYFPSGLQITGVYDAQVDLKWTFPDITTISIPEDYKLIIERRTYGKSRWKEVVDLPITETTWRDTTVDPDTIYYYRIKTQYPNGHESTDIPHNSGVSRRTPYPLNTELWGFGLSDSSIRLRWDMSDTTDCTAVLQRKDPAGNFQTIYTSKRSDTYVDSGLDRDQTYTYRLMMRSETGQNSEFTQEISVLTETVPRPWSLTCNALTSERIALTWVHPYEVKTGFEVWRKGSDIWEKIAVLPNNTTSFIDTDIESGKNFIYQVRALIGETAFSPFSPSCSVDYSYPATPSKPIYYTQNNILHLFSNEKVPQGTTYTLEYREDLNSQWKVFKTCEEDYLIALLYYSDHTQYQFRICASKGNLESVSPIFDFYGKPPIKPSDLKAQLIGYSRVLLTWDNMDDTAEGCYIYRITDDGKKTLLGYVDIDDGSYIDESPLSGTTSSYEITAYNAVGESSAEKVTVSIPQIRAFKDIDSFKWAHNAIYTLLGKGSVNYEDGYFRPQSSLTKGEAVSWVLSCFDILHESHGLYTVTDLTPSHTYYKDIITAINLGLIHPDTADRIFPDDIVSRKDIIVFLNNTLNHLGISSNPSSQDILKSYVDYYDINPNEKHIIASFVNDGIIAGDKNRLGLSDNATRAEAAVIIYRTIQKYIK